MLALLLLSITAICAANELFLPYENTSNHVYSVAGKIANKHFDLRFDTLVYSMTCFHYPLKYFFQEYRGVLTYYEIYKESNLSLFESRIQYKITQYVIEVKHVRYLDYILDSLKQNKSFENNSKFILLCDNTDNLKDGCDAKLAFEFCWKYRIANVVILNGNKQKHMFVLTYFPISSNHCHNTEPAILETVPSVDEYGGLVNVFPKKFENFHRCKFIVSTFHFPPYISIETLKNGDIRLGGSEGPLAHILIEKLNATLEVVTPADGQLYGDFNGSVWTGSLGYSFTNRANMSLGSALMTTQRVEFFRASYPYRMCVFGWISPPSRLRPAWEKLIKPFDRTLRIYFATFLLVIMLVLMALKETRVRYLWSSYFTQDPLTNGLYVETCALFLGQVGRWRPNHMVLSFVLTMWVWFTFIMRSSYQGALIGPLKYDVYDPQFSTLPEAIKDGFEIGGSQNVITYIEDEPDLYHLYKVVETKEMVNIMERIANGSLKFVYLVSVDALCIFNLRVAERKQLNLLPEFAIVVPLANYFPRDSPLVETIDAMYGRIVASGIEAKFTADNNVVKQYLNTKRQWLDKTEQRLSMRNMQACFVVMAIGSLTSTVVFVAELLWHKWADVVFKAAAG